MSAVTFDTLDAVKRLREAGYNDKQAEEIVRVIGDAQERLVTKEHFDGRFTLLQWMLGVNLAFTMAVLWKVIGA